MQPLGPPAGLNHNACFDWFFKTSDINSQCLGNILRVDVPQLGGKLLEVAAIVSKQTFLNLLFKPNFPLFFVFFNTPVSSFILFLTCLFFSSSDNSSIILTPSLASQCGFSIKRHQPGSAVIYASLLNCFADNVVRDRGHLWACLRVYRVYFDS